MTGLKNDLQAEEWLADAFVLYARGRRLKKGWNRQIKAFLRNVWEEFKKVFGKEDKVRGLFEDVIGKER